MSVSISRSFELLFFLIVYILIIPLAESREKISCNVTAYKINHPLKRSHTAKPLMPPKCGYVTKRYMTRVVGGSPADVGAWPWIVTLGYEIDQADGLDFKCGGTLISHRHILTAAHCVCGYNNRFFVRLGEHDLGTADDGAVDILVKQISIHPDYNPTTYENDIAVMKLSKKVKFTDAIHPICLPVDDALKEYNFVKHYLFLVGWGSTATNGPYSDVLLETQVPVVDNQDCATAYRNHKNTVVDDRILCAGFMEGGKDSCEGDSGGPLIYPQKQMYYVVGVVSGGSENCAEPGVPGLYTRVTSFLDFILSNMN